MAEYMCRAGGPPAGHCEACWIHDAGHAVAFHLTGYTEPEQVYNLFFQKPAADYWRNLFKSWQPTIQYGGVFTHQKPYVTYDPARLSPPKVSAVPKKCELADLLIIFTDTSLHKRRAILLQAKKGTKWLPSNKTQWDLLNQWPEISYQIGSKTITRKMPFSGHHDSGGKYMLLTHPHAVVNPAKVPYSPVSLEKALERIVMGKMGRGFSFDRASATNDWDELIWDLIEHTAKTNATLAGATYSRGAGVLSFCDRSIVPPDELGGHDPEEDDEWGIPILQLSGQSAEERKHQ